MAETKSSAPDLSIIVVTHNSRQDLLRLLPTLVAPALTIEILTIDNASDDGTVDWLRKFWPTVKTIATGANLGYGRAVNRGLETAAGRVLMVLNPDTRVRTGALETLVDLAQSAPHDFFTAKLILPDGRVNACGMEMHYSGITTCRGLGQPAGLFQGTVPVPLLSGAAIAADRAAWQQIGGFDEHLFLYMEDTELSLRARLLGHRLWCAQDAVVEHDYHLALSPAKLAWLESNRLWVLFKLFGGPTILRLLPALLLTGLATWCYAALRGWPYLEARARALSTTVSRIPQLVDAHREFQQRRQVPDDVVLRDGLVVLPFRQLVDSQKTADALTRLVTPLYRWLLGPLRAVDRPLDQVFTVSPEGEGQ